MNWRTKRGLALISVPILALGGAGMWARWQRSGDRWSAGTGKLRILVTRFESSLSDTAVPRALPESLAAALRAVADVDTHTGREPDRNVDLVLAGTMTRDNGGVALSLRLHPPGARASTWTGTFWRHTLMDSSLVRDLATAVAEGAGAPRHTPLQPRTGR